MEHTCWIVQFWEPKYAYWRTLANPDAESMSLLSIPSSDFDTEESGLARLSVLRGSYPEGQYRLAKVTTITEVVA